MAIREAITLPIKFFFLGAYANVKQYSEIEQQTKKIYIEQHKNYLLDKQLFERHRTAAQDVRTYDLPTDYFRGIHILDAGCGNTGYFQVAMYNLGAGHVTCMDLGKEWIPELQKTLLHHNIPPSFCLFMEGSTLNIPAEDKTFDLVCSNGVIMHLETPEMAADAIKELARVCRIGGNVYAHIGIDKPGVVDRFIVKSLRVAYQEDTGFKNFVVLPTI